MYRQSSPTGACKRRRSVQSSSGAADAQTLSLGVLYELRKTMSDWIYCGTDHQANADGTQSLLRAHQAIWCSPPGLRAWPDTPVVAGERIWLVWRDTRRASLVLLGGGVLLSAP